MGLLDLQGGDLRLRVDPDRGGAIVGFWSEFGERRFDWFRAAAGAGNPSCFPLVPYSNRIRGGRFSFQGREIALPLNFGGSPHSIHGHGWQAPWRIVETGPDRLVLSYRHAPDAWPFAYESRQVLRLSEDALEIGLDVRNLGRCDMPAGLGLHPYFPLRGRARVRAAVSGVWLTDGEVMPIGRASPPPRWDLRAGAEVAGMDIDNAFDGWDGTARIDWPDAGAALTISAGGPLGHLVVFAPPGRDFFCVEPVSHMTDAFNLANAGTEETGMRVLAPGATLSARVAFSPSMSA